MSQAQKLLNLLSDGLGHRTDEIMQVVYGDSHLGLARIGARCWDLKHKGYTIIGWHDTENPTLYWYRMLTKTEEVNKPSASLPALHTEEIKTQPRLFELSPIDNRPKLGILM